MPSAFLPYLRYCVISIVSDVTIFLLMQCYKFLTSFHSVRSKYFPDIFVFKCWSWKTTEHKSNPVRTTYDLEVPAIESDCCSLADFTTVGQQLLVFSAQTVWLAPKRDIGTVVRCKNMTVYNDGAAHSPTNQSGEYASSDKPCLF
jgi:hypothetical protein